MRKINLVLIITLLLGAACNQPETGIIPQGMNDEVNEPIAQVGIIKSLDWDDNFEYSSSWEVLDSDENVLVSKKFTEREATGFEIQSEEDVGRIVRVYDTRIAIRTKNSLPCFEEMDQLKGGNIRLGDHDFYLCFVAPEGLVSFVYSIIHPETGSTIYFSARGALPDEEIKKATEEVLSTLKF